MLYRNQWSSISRPYQTGLLDAEAKFPIGRKDDFITGGIQLDYDAAGSSGFKTSQVLPTINYHKSLDPHRNMYLSIGFMGGFTQRRVDPAKLTFDNQYQNGSYDPTSSSGEFFERYQYAFLDMATGISFNSQFGASTNWFAGASYYHFNNPKNSFFDNPSVSLKPKWQFHAGISSNPNDYSKIILYLNHLRQGSLTETIFGGLWGYAISLNQGASENMKMIYGGLFVRWEDAIIPTIKMELDKFDIGMSYDINYSKATRSSQGFGGFELTLTYKGFFNRPRSSLNAIVCPKF